MDNIGISLKLRVPQGDPTGSHTWQPSDRDHQEYVDARSPGHTTNQLFLIIPEVRRIIGFR